MHWKCDELAKFKVVAYSDVVICGQGSTRLGNKVPSCWYHLCHLACVDAQRIACAVSWHTFILTLTAATADARRYERQRMWDSRSIFSTDLSGTPGPHAWS
jgi:hypothetical protein